MAKIKIAKDCMANFKPCLSAVITSDTKQPDTQNKSYNRY